MNPSKGLYLPSPLYLCLVFSFVLNTGLSYDTDQEQLFQILQQPYNPQTEQVEQRADQLAELLDLTARQHHSAFDSLARVAKEFAEKQNYPNLNLSYYQAQGIHKLLGGDYSSAYNFAKLGMLDARKISKPKVSVGVFQNLIGTIYSHLEDYETSTKTYLESIESTKKDCKQSTDSLCHMQVVYAQSNIGSNYVRLGENLRGLEYFSQALDHCQILLGRYPSNQKLKYLRGTLIGSKGIAHKNLKKWEQAEQFLLEAIRIFRNIEERNNLAVTLQHLGEVFSARGEYDRARQTLMESVQIREHFNMHTTELAETYNAMAKFCLQQQDFEMTRSLLEKSIKIGTKNEVHQILMESYRIKAKLDSLLQDYEGAYEALIHYNKHNATHLQDQIERNKAKWEAQQDFKRQMENEKRDGKRRTAVFLIVLVSLIVVILLFDLNRQRLEHRNSRFSAEQKELNASLSFKEKEVAFKNQELAGLSSRLMERNIFIKQIQEELKGDPADREQILKNIKKKLNLEFQSKKDLDQFRLRLDELNQSYYFELSQKYPELTKNERRLCAVVRMGLNTNDIANLDGSSPSAIRTRKSRLKKKLGIYEQSLEDFLHQS